MLISVCYVRSPSFACRIPHTVNEWFMYGATFEPVCEESEACRTSYDKAPPRDGPGHRPVCKCSGDWNYAVEVVDKVQIPTDLKPGKYVLGWYVSPLRNCPRLCITCLSLELLSASVGESRRRWDCEESTQVWTSCRYSARNPPPPRLAMYPSS